MFIAKIAFLKNILVVLPNIVETNAFLRFIITDIRVYLIHWPFFRDLVAPFICPRWSCFFWPMIHELWFQSINSNFGQVNHHFVKYILSKLFRKILKRIGMQYVKFLLVFILHNPVVQNLKARIVISAFFCFDVS